MSDFDRRKNGIASVNIGAMKTGYEEMGMLNVSLSEEGLDQDTNDLERYEKYLVESE